MCSDSTIYIRYWNCVLPTLCLLRSDWARPSWFTRGTLYFSRIRRRSIMPRLPRLVQIWTIIRGSLHPGWICNAHLLSAPVNRWFTVCILCFISSYLLCGSNVISRVICDTVSIMTSLFARWLSQLHCSRLYTIRATRRGGYICWRN